MAVKFSNAFVAEMRPALTIEDVWRELSTYGGIHSFKFDSLVDTDTFAAGTWNVGSGTWDYGGTLVGHPDGTATYSFVWWNGTTPPSFVADVDIDTDVINTCISFRGNGNDFYFVRLTGNSVGFYRVDDGVETLLTDLTYSDTNPLPGPGRIRLAVRQYQFSENDVDRWLFMSVWMDDRLLLSAYDQIADVIPGYSFGLGMYNGNVSNHAGFTAVRIPDMTEIIPWASIDPGETPLQGIQRAIADRVIKSFVRFDGTLRAWRPKPSTTCQIFTADGEMSFATEVDLRELYNHVRLYYSLSWLETHDPTLYEAYGHRFVEVNNTYIEDDTEAFNESVAIIRRSKENAFRCDLTNLRGGYLLEPEDKVMMPDGEEYITESLAIRWDKNTLIVSIKGRLYAFLS